MTRRWRAGLWILGAAATLLVSAFVVLAWAGSCYVDLVRQQVGIADACSRVESASRERIELVDNLIRGAQAFGRLDDTAAAGVRAAVTRITDLRLTPDSMRERADWAGYRAAQDRLTVEVAALRARLGEAEVGTTDRAPLAPLDAKLVRCESELAGGLDLLERRVHSFRRDATRFPGSLVAELIRLDAGFEQPGVRTP